ncbi:50S ribosomal protein L24 [Patescibacteria group bacterium]|nr:50S ribosomal protein L24 [Patescibacteria group bacterium]
MKIKKGDQVLIISGKYRGKKGKVLKAFPKEQRLLIEGVNLRKKHIRPKREGEKGQIVELPAPIHISNVKLICPKCKKATKVGYKVISKRTLRGGAKGSSKDQKSKVRICKKCGQKI